MKQRIVLALFTLHFSLFTLSLSAQQVWTLQQCMDHALLHNLSVRQSELSHELNKVVLNQSYFNFFPTLNGFASNNYYFGRSIDPYTNQFTEQQVRSNSFSLSSSISLFEGFRLQNTLAQSRLNYLSGKYDLEKVRNDIALNVVTAYLQVLYNKELIGIAREQRDATILQRDRTKRMEELGGVSKGNLLDIESQLASEEVSLITAQSQYDQALLTLQQLLELDSQKDFQIVEPELPLPEYDIVYADVNAIYQTALNTLPDIKSADYLIKSADKGVAIAKSAMYPRITASGNLATTYSTSSQRIQQYIISPTPFIIGYTSSFDTVYSILENRIPVLEQTPFRDQVSDNLGKSIGFSLVIPIFNNWNTQTSIKRARLNLEQSRLSNDLIRQSVYKSIQQASSDAIASYNKFSAGEKSVAAQQEALNYNRQRFDLGLISTYDYLIAKNNFARAKAELLQARYDYVFRIKVLDFYMGKPLTF